MKIADIDLIAAWLVGELKDGSPADFGARRALAKALRHGPLAPSLRAVIADLIDPETGDDIGMKLVFKRAQGAKRTMDRRKVAAIIWKQIKAGVKKDAAVADAMKKCDVRSRDKALAAFNEYRPILEKYGSKLKALTRTDD
jgi:hypothetical protein